MSKEISVGVKLVTDLQDFNTGFKQAQDTNKKFGESVEKNVATPLSKLTGQLRTLKAAQSRALTPEQFASIGKEIQKVQGDIDKFKGKINQTSSPIDNLIGQAKGLLPAFGFAAIAAGAVAASKQIIASTSATADEWEFQMKGLTTGLDFFWKTLATGDWSNFTTRMQEAIKSGYEYASMLDTIQDQTRALSMIESDATDEAMDLEIRMRNKLLSRSERIKAGNDRIALEDKLVKYRKTIAEENYQNELKEAARQTKMSEAQLVQIAKDINSEKRLRAEEFNDKQKQYDKMKRANTASVGSSITGATSQVQLKESAPMAALRAEIEETNSDIKEYAKLINDYDILNDESQKNFVEAYVKRNEAAVSGKEHIKKIITQVNSLLAGEEENGNKIMNETNTYAEKLKVLNKQLEDTNETDTQAIKIIYAKIDALNKLNMANDATKKNIRAEVTNNTNLSPISSISAKSVTGPVNSVSGLATKGIYSDATKELEAYIEKQEEAKQKMEAVAGAFADGFSNIGQSVVKGLGLANDGLEGFVGGLASVAVQFISMMLAKSLATAIFSAEQMAALTGPGAIFSAPVFIAQAIAGVMSAFAVLPKFATGGVIPGSSFNGDKVLARVNSGEEILTASDPRHRNNRKNGNFEAVETQVSFDNAVLKGEDIYIIMKKVERRINRRT